MGKPKSNYTDFITVIRSTLRMSILALGLMAAFIVYLILFPPRYFKLSESREIPVSWMAPDINSVPKTESGKLIHYGRELIVNTTYYLGPNGTVRKMSNGMNCQNCHLEAGTKPFGNNFSAVKATYPKYRARYGSIVSIENRVNDCFERSLNGQPLENQSLEMRAILAYLHWVGKDVQKEKASEGSRLLPLSYLDRAASPEKGKDVYVRKCMMCHGNQGEGLRNHDGTFWVNPPLWGDHSYNVGAGLYRLSCFAEFVKTNMPIGVNFDAPQLSDEEAWDVAAYVNSMPRPMMNLDQDWPDISSKPVDYPFGPYTDTFSAAQHKYGPFMPIVESQKKIHHDKKAFP